MALSTRKTISGKVEKVVFQNNQNGYTVLSLQPLEQALGKVVVVGCFTEFFTGEEVSFHGDWQKHPKHGVQFFAQSYEIQKRDPQSVAQKLLVHHLDGIGPSYAKKLQVAFGEKILEVLDKQPEKLKEISGIGKVRYQKIIQSWQKHKSSHETMIFLTSHRLGVAMASKVYKKYGQGSIQIIQKNPYQLIQDIDGIGFHTADNIAQSLGIEQDAPQRLKAGLIYVIQQATKYGHCGIEQNHLIQQSAELLNNTADNMAEYLDALQKEKVIIIDKVREQLCAFLPQLYEQEIQIAKKLNALLLTTPSDISTLKSYLKEEIKKEALTLSLDQNKAIIQALQSQVFVLTGGPGVGKTTLVRLLTKIFAKNKLSIGLGAPTGRAAKRLSEVTAMTAKTIHRLLEYDPFTNQFGFDQENPLPFEVVIIDEASMLDVPLCDALLKAIDSAARIIFVGDVDQLASVGPGDVLRSMIASQKIPYFFLKEIFRQSAHSQIIVNAHRINQGLMPLMDPALTPDFYIVGTQSIEEQQRKVVAIVSNRLKNRFGFDPIDDIQVLSPVNEGPLGVNTLNTLLQEILNPTNAIKVEVNYRDGLFRTGDKVIQTVNNYDKNIFNGDIGKIHQIDLAQQKLEVTFDQQTIEYQFKELDQLRLAYAISVHKSQGSEYAAVVVVLSMQQKMMLKRNLLYTAISRGKSCVVVVASQAAMAYAIQTHKVTPRINKLEEWLRDAK